MKKGRESYKRYLGDSLEKRKNPLPKVGSRSISGLWRVEEVWEVVEVGEPYQGEDGWFVEYTTERKERNNDGE